MLDAHDEIRALARRRSLPPDLARELHDLFARLLGTGGGSVSTVLLDGPVPAATPEAHADARRVDPAPPDRPTDRYEDLGIIGVGGMGEVRRVRDRALGRTLAMKVIRADLLGRAAVVARFLEEAQVGAQLQHPGVAPIHEVGTLPDGRLYFTMKEIRGRPFGEAIHEVHAAEGGAGDVGMRRLCDVFAKVCDAVGYAHSRGVVHRDLKPANVMVGGHGEVLVIDWGLAKVVGRDEVAPDPDEEGSIRSARDSDAHRTRFGSVLGTAAYMAPEQARGEVATLDARADVYALGAMLYEVLSGRPPYEGPDARAVLRLVLAGPPPPPDRAGELPLPAELVALCLRAMARDPADRPAEASDVASEVRAWLDGAKRREAARSVVAEADAQGPAADALREAAAELRIQAARALAGVAAWEPEERKAAGWAKEDEASALERRAALGELRREALLRGALTHAPDLVEAHAGLVELELERHRAAEGRRDERRAERAEIRLREHADALPERHEVRRRAAVYLRGDGALTLHTDPPGAEVELYRYELRNRRRVPVPVRHLGRTPLREVSLPMGSYLCLLRSPDGREVRYPVSVGRGEHWDGVPPGALEPLPVWMPVRGELAADDCLVPAGWSWSGGDPEAFDGLSARRLWIDALVVKRFPVINQEYLLFLDDLVADGREEEASRHAPRERAASGEGAPIYGRGEAGGFVLRRDADGDVWDPAHPVLLVDWFGAAAYAEWLAKRTGRPWRLLGELEWEKVARGADGRFYPWGDAMDPSWCCMGQSHAGRRLPATVDRFPVDTSVYGVRGLGGNTQDWCADVFRREGPVLDGDRPASPPPHELGDAPRVHRGGFWNGAARNARSASRYRNEPGNRHGYLGLRVAFRP